MPLSRDSVDGYDSSREPSDTTTLNRLLISCTVFLKSEDGRRGTGFFVGNGWILTCAHVVGKPTSPAVSASTRDGAIPRQTIQIKWRNAETVTGVVHATLPVNPPDEGSVPLPDIALIRFDSTPWGSDTGTPHPCVLLHTEFAPSDPLFGWGYPREFAGGDSLLGTAEGWSDPGTGDPEARYLKFRETQVVGGMSGGPLLNLRTGGICGLIKQTRGAENDLGGRGIPIALVLRCFPEIVDWQHEYHGANSSWLDLLDESQMGFCRASRCVPESLPIPLNPYKGLSAFQEADSSNFYGRSRFVDDLYSRVTGKVFTAVIGPSGSGKSSVVGAGLIPRLRQYGWQIIVCRPGTHPFHELAAALIYGNSLPFSESATPQPTIPALPDATDAPPPANRGVILGGVPVLKTRIDETGSNQALEEVSDFAQTLRDEGGAKRLAELVPYLIPPSKTGSPTGDALPCVLVAIDQFEELFTLCHDEAERLAFLSLIQASTSPEGQARQPRLRILVSLRADFLSKALTYSPLVERLQNADLKLGPMSEEDLREAIVRPARSLGVSVERSLLNRIVTTVSRQPGSLPLLQFALTHLWQVQTRRLLTEDAYDRIGGVERALANHAESRYEALTEDERLLAPRLFVQLIRPGVGTSDTRRTALRSDLGESKWALAMRLADIGTWLIVLGRSEGAGEETAEIVHEALITAWDRLSGWIEADRAFRSWQEDMREWVSDYVASHRQDEGLLIHSAARREEAATWREERPDDLSPSEIDYIDASIAWSEREKEEERAEQARQIEQAQALAEAAEARAAAAQAVSDADKVRADAAQEKSEADRKARVIAQENERTAKVSATRLRNVIASLALSLLITLCAFGFGYQQLRHATASSLSGYSLRDGDGQPELAGLLAIFANKLEQHDAKTEDALLQAAQRNARALAYLPGVDATVWSVAYSQESNRIAAGDTTGNITLWNAKTFRKMDSFSVGGRTVYSLDFSPDGTLLAAGCEDGSLHIWNTTTWQPLWENSNQGSRSKPDTPVKGVGIHCVRFRPDKTAGYVLATCGADEKVTLWKIERSNTGSQLDCTQAKAIDKPDNGLIYSLTWGTRRRASGKNESLLTYGCANGHVVIQSIPQDPAQNNAQLCDIDAEKDAIYAVACTPAPPAGEIDEEPLIAVGGKSQEIRLYDTHGNALGDSLSTSSDSAYTSPFFSLAFSRITLDDGSRRVLLASATVSGKLQLWDVDRNQLLDDQSLVGTHQGQIDGICFSQDGKYLVSGGWDRHVVVWDAAPKYAHRLKHVWHPHQSAITDVAFVDKGRKLLTADVAGDIQQHDPVTGAPLGAHDELVARTRTKNVANLAYCPATHILASAHIDGQIALWDTVAENPLMPPFSASKRQIYSVAFSSDGRLLAAASADHSITLWEMRGGQAPRQLASGRPLTDHGGEFNGVAFNRDSSLLAAASDDNKVRLWDIRDRDNPRLKWRLTEPDNIVVSLAFNPVRPTELAAGDATGKIWIWDNVAIGNSPNVPILREQLKRPRDDDSEDSETVESLSWDAQGLYLAAGRDDDRFMIWNVNSRSYSEEADFPENINTVAFAPGHPALVAADNAGNVVVRGVSSGSAVGQPVFLRQAQQTSDSISAAVWINDHAVAYAGPAEKITLVDLNSHKTVVFGNTDQSMNQTAFSSDGAFAVSVSSNGSLYLWDLQHGSQQPRSWQPPKNLPDSRSNDPNESAGSKTYGLPCVAIRPDGRELAAGDKYGHIFRYSIDASGATRPEATLVFNGGGHVGSVAYSQDGKTIAAGGGNYSDYSIDVWRNGNSQPSILKGHTNNVTSLAFSHDGRQLASASRDRSLRTWQLSANKPLITGIGHLNELYAVAYSPDDKWLVTGSVDNRFQLWDALTGQPFGGMFDGHSDSVSGVAIDPSGQRLATVGYDGRLILTDIDPISWQKIVRRVSGRPLSREEWRTNKLWIANPVYTSNLP